MSAILGLFGADGRLPDDAGVRAMLARMRGRGADRVAVWRGDGGVLAVARHAWECSPGFAGDAVVAEDDALVAVADASLYYQDDLRRRLTEAGIRRSGDTPSHLVLSAFRAWGPQSADRLEGDFAFIVYDRVRRVVHAARDFGGRRPLFFAEARGGFVVASSVAGVLAFPGVEEAFDLRAVASVAAGLLGASRATAYRGVTALQAGEGVTRADGAAPTVSAHWEPPIYESGSELGFEDAALHLRELLCRATEERLDPGGPTSVWMSGGWDSTAVFGAGEELFRRRGQGERLDIVSISYPKGDPGREDELILDIAAHWQRPVNWIDIADVPFFDGIVERAAERDQPMAHVYENWNRALIAESRRLGARVALDGFGGDGLFQVSPVFLADLAVSGQWAEFGREWKAKRLRASLRNAYTCVVRPLLPPAILDGAAILRGGKRLEGEIERQIPSWLRSDFVRQHDLTELTRSPVVWRSGEGAAARETQWHLRTPWVPAILSCLSDLGLENGVEGRSPLYDRRVIDFAATRPREDRSLCGETKRLLRASMRGLLPDHVLAPRKSRTGMTTGYFDRSMHSELAKQLLSTFTDRAMLVELGIIDIKEFWQSAGRYLRGKDTSTGVELLLTLQTELWLRAHGGRAIASEPRADLHVVGAGR